MPASPSLLSPWFPLLSISVVFPPSIFTRVMLNLLRNPNLTSSHLFRADIYYDSCTDETAKWPEAVDADATESSERVRWMRAKYWPRLLGDLGGVEALRGEGGREWEWRRTWVRELVPRKPEVDRRLIQSCHLFQAYVEEEGKVVERTLMVYVPHVDNAEEMPFYHPTVRAVAFLHEWHPLSEYEGSGTLSIHIIPFPVTGLDADRLDRTVRKLLQVLHKHGHGQLQGYTKHVHHDQIIGQKRFQDEYTRLKSTYAKTLCEGWAEATDPRKHVFEDLGIAAFLICLWEDTYCNTSNDGEYRLYVTSGKNERGNGAVSGEKGSGSAKGNFAGFVDIGCGNGVLVNVLIQEGWEGWGFDVRRRKSWEDFPQEVKERLEERVLVPEILQRVREQRVDENPMLLNTSENEPASRVGFHNGVFPKGTFIISNHADELTGWTPLLARLSECPFIAIPCCSHSLAGARFRAPARGLKSQSKEDIVQDQSADKCEQPKTGILKKAKDASRPPSAYASLCSYITTLTEYVGYFPEKEMLRIPSTRNAAIIGRKSDVWVDEVAEEKIARLLEEELAQTLEQTACNWIDQANKIIKSKGSH